MLELLKDKVYIKYWLAVVVSFLGDAITLTTIIYLIGSSTNSVLMISYVFIANLLPSVILGPFIGPLIDRMQRRYVMVIADIYRLVLVAMMFVFQENLIVLFILLFLMGIGSAFFEPARIASVPTLVGLNRIPQGIALFQSTSATIKFLGPVIAGLIIAYFGVKWAFLIDMVTYGVSAALLYTLSVLDVDLGTKERKQHYFSDLVNGVKRMFHIPIIKILFVLLVPIMFSMGMFLANYKGMMFQIFEVSAIEFGWLEGLLATGIVLGAVMGPKLINKLGYLPLIYGSLLFVGIFSVSVFTLPILHNIAGIYPVLIWSILIGIGESLLQVPTSNIILTNLPPEIRGQGVALTNSLLNSLYLFGSFIGGIIASKTNSLYAISIVGGILLTTFLISILSKKLLERKKVSLGA